MLASVESGVRVIEAYNEWYGSRPEKYEGILFFPKGQWIKSRTRWMKKGEEIWRCYHQHDLKKDAQYCSDDALFQFSIDEIDE